MLLEAHGSPSMGQDLTSEELNLSFIKIAQVVQHSEFSDVIQNCIKVHWTPRDADEYVQRQRHQLRRRRPQAARAERGFPCPVRRSERIRRRRRVMGSRGEVRQTSRRSRNRQRATDRTGTVNPADRSGGHPRFSAPNPVEPGPQRRRCTNPSAFTDRVLLASIISIAGVSGPNSLLREMATCLLSQATVLATVVQNISDGPSGTQQMAAPHSQSAAQRPRPRPRGQRAATAVGTRTLRRNRKRARRQGASHRLGD
ncbi:uncharacterized protein LOC126763926 isoform X2 [Bactrocera neohumeralis]|uniref:uncharacterized protein LOC126763926 isoform X1 n=1 Tax=Bactrocera neohumeralis TaxID=98809 RepID=UPI0021653612|nr:uncharacterized protein LOC126763926 isoform X1 [Bactrocera neohumeralis]XP_050337658.1 uncharacterized protein LOC126763926 isoform X2 [Bactrocera neohumeralis]